MRYSIPLLVTVATLTGACGAVPDDADEAGRRAGDVFARAVASTRDWLRERTGGAAEDPSAVRPAAPTLTGTTSDGQPFDLADWRGTPVVLVFYRGADCGLCTHRLAALESHLDRYHRLGARVAAVTPDTPETAARTSRELQLRLPIVSVPRDVLERWGVWPPGQHAPHPVAAIIDAAGRIAHSHVGDHAGDRTPDVVLLAELNRLDRPSRTDAARGVR